MERETHEEKVITYVLGILEDARAFGTLRGGTFRLDTAGLARYKKLKEEKFKPSQQEIEIAYTLLASPPEDVMKAAHEYKKYSFVVTIKNFFVKLFK